MHAVLKFHYNLAFVPSLELQSSAELAVKVGLFWLSGFFSIFFSKYARARSTGRAVTVLEYGYF